MPSAALWRGDQWVTAECHQAVRPTGFAALDAELPGGGWPDASLTELLLPTPGAGAEWLLLAPSLARNTATHQTHHGAARQQAAGSTPDATPRPILCVAPPHLPYAPALATMGLAPDRWLHVLPISDPDAAWAAEQGIKSKACAAVFWWVSANMRPAALNNSLRRLQLAAQTHQTPIFVVRSTVAQNQASPAPVRLSLQAIAPGKLAVTVFKRRGLPMVQPLVLLLSSLIPKASKQVHVLTSTKEGPPAPSTASWSAAPSSSVDLSNRSLPSPTTKKGLPDVVVCLAPARLAA